MPDTPATPVGGGESAVANATPGAMPGETKAETAARLYKVTVDGAEREVTEDELRRGYSHGTAAAERMRQANETRQQAEQVLKIFKENPKEAFSRLGVDAKAFAEQILSEHMEDAMLTDDQKEMKRLKKWESEMRAKDDAAKAEQAAAAEAAFREQVSQQLQQDIIGTLESSGLPKNEYTVGRMAYYMDAAISAGFNNVSAKDIISHVKEEYQKDVKALLSSVPEDALLGFLGDDFTKKTVKAHLAKVNKNKPAVKPVTTSTPKTAQEGKKIISPSEFFRRRR
jgi:primosomal protein N'